MFINYKIVTISYIYDFNRISLVNKFLYLKCYALENYPNKIRKENMF